MDDMYSVLAYYNQAVPTTDQVEPLLMVHRAPFHVLCNPSATCGVVEMACALCWPITTKLCPQSTSWGAVNRSTLHRLALHSCASRLYTFTAASACEPSGLVSANHCNPCSQYICTKF